MSDQYQSFYGEDLLPDLVSMSFVHLRNRRRNAFLRKALRVGGASEQPSNALLIDHARTLAHHLKPLAASLDKLHHPKKADFVLFENLPIDPQLPAPLEDGRRPASKTTWVSELTLLAAAVVAGLEPLTYQKLHSDVLVQEMVPTQAQTVISLGQTAFGFQTDMAILNRSYRPEMVLLLGLANASETPTLIATLDRALDWLSQEAPAALAVLQSPRFRISFPEALTTDQGKVIYSEPRPVLTFSPNLGWEMAGNFPTLQAVDAEAQMALVALQRALDQAVFPIFLMPGTLLVFNNHRVAHGRWPMAGQQWVQKLYGRRSLEAIRQATGQGEQQHGFDVRSLISE